MINVLIRLALAALLMFGAFLVLKPTPDAAAGPEHVCRPFDEYVALMSENHPDAAALVMTQEQVVRYFSWSGMVTDPQGAQVTWFSREDIPTTLVTVVRAGCVTSLRVFPLKQFLAEQSLSLIMDDTPLATRLRMGVPMSPGG